jgi:putative inorganic carbon (HCO3(-)) transporter
LKTAIDKNVSSQLLLTLAAASVIAILFSIAAAQILLGAGLLVLLLQPRSWRWPPILAPLGLFAAWTLAAKIAGQGLLAPSAQLRKFFVYLVVILVFAAVRRAVEARWILIGVCAAGALSAAWSLVQFVRKALAAEAANADFYTFYVGARTTGFMSHWMTFSAEMTVVLAIAAAYLLFGRRERPWIAIAGAAAVLSAVALLLNLTRGAWLAAAAALIYLLAVGRPRWLLALPVAAVAGFAISPQPVKERVLSIVRPHGETDSNRHRYVTWRTGVAMIQARPVLGLGPEMVEKRFDEFVPPDITRPLPDGWYGHLHNLYLQIAAERGLPALALMLWLLGTFARDWIRAARRFQAGRGDERFVLQAAMAVLISVLVNGFFEYNLGNSEPLHLFLGVAGCAYAVYESSASSSFAFSQRATV